MKIVAQSTKSTDNFTNRAKKTLVDRRMCSMNYGCERYPFLMDFFRLSAFFYGGVVGYLFLMLNPFLT